MTTLWDLEEADVKAIESVLGKGTLSKDTFEITRGYDGRRWVVPINESAVLSHLADAHNVTGGERTSLLEQKESDKALAWIKESNEASEQLKATAEAISKFRDGRATLTAIDILSKRLPAFLYFGSYDQMNGKVSLPQLQQEVANDTVTPRNRVFLAFLQYAKIPLDELPKLNSFETLIAKLEGASNAITRQVFEYWTQNPYLRVSFSQNTGMMGDPPPFNSGWILRTRIYNELHQVTVDFDDRSTGFVWFFSFLALFSQIQKTHGNLVILLDEPGLSLHGKAQGDLLRYFDEKLKPQHQVIYTTHSPFMVPPDGLTTVRTVEDVVWMEDGKRPVSEGTKVREDVLATDKDTIFPLQGALGYEITQTLFVGKHTLLVEGPGDVLMLQSASAKLKALGREGLKNEWTLCPVGGIGNIMAFVNLFGGGNKLDVAVLSDYAKRDKQTLERLKENKVLKEGRILTLNEFCNQDEADMEDMFGPVLYARMVNDAFNVPAGHEVY